MSNPHFHPYLFGWLMNSWTEMKPQNLVQADLKLDGFVMINLVLLNESLQILSFWKTRRHLYDS